MPSVPVTSYRARDYSLVGGTTPIGGVGAVPIVLRQRHRLSEENGWQKGQSAQRQNHRSFVGDGRPIPVTVINPEFVPVGAVVKETGLSVGAHKRVVALFLGD